MAHKAILAVRIAAIPTSVAAIAFIEFMRPFFELPLFALGAGFVLLAVLTSVLRGRRRDLVLIATSSVFGMLVVEAVAEHIAPAPPQRVDTPKLSVYWPEMGWGPRPGQIHEKEINPITKATIYEVDYTIGSNLLRQTRSCDACATVVFFGDSFTFGHGVNDADTLPQAFANIFDRKLRVLNLAFPGYGPQHFLRELQNGRFDEVIGPRPKLFVFLTAAWHAERTACKRHWLRDAPRYALEQGRLVYTGACAARKLWLPDWIAQTAIYRAFIDPVVKKPTYGDVDLYIRILLAAADLAREKYGAPTLIAYLKVPDAYLRGTGFSNAEIVRRLQDGHAAVVDVTLSKQRAADISIPGDGHPTPYANRLRAAILKNYIQGVPGLSESMGIDRR